jgi:hypothetical protein
VPITLDGPSAPGRRVPLPAPNQQWIDANIQPSRLLPRSLERSLLLHGMDAVMVSLRDQARLLGCEGYFSTGGSF